MTAKDSSSSVADRSTDLFRFELGARLPKLLTAFHSGRDLDLLEPLGLWSEDFNPGRTRGDIVAPRPEIAKVLGDANASYHHPRAAELAAKLADPETRVVVTGQQPGLFGGPLLALSKTLAALKHAAALEARGLPAVAIFWVATEDHDWAEIARATFLDRHDATDLELGQDDEPLRPVGKRLLGSEMDVVAERARELIRGDEAVRRLERALDHYRADATVGSAFIRLMIEILGERAPLYLDSQLPALKELQKPMLRAMIERRGELDDAYTAAEKAITDRSYSLQVSPQPGVSPLFLEEGGERRRIEWRGDDRFTLRGRDDFEAPVDELLEILEREPGRVSPGVLARPAIQDALLSTTLQVLGPAELSYMGQAKAAHQLLGLEGVHSTLRPQTMVIEAKGSSWLEELEIPLVELLDRPLEESIAERLGTDIVTPIREAIEEQLSALRSSVLEVDKSLAKPFDKTHGHIDRGLDTLASKIAGAVARNNEVWLRRLEQLKSSLKPAGTLQERRLATAFLWVRYGDELIDAIFEQLELGPLSLSVIRLGRS